MSHNRIRIVSPVLNTLTGQKAAMSRKPIAPPSTNRWSQTPQSYSFCPKMRQKDAVFAVSAQKNAVKVCRLRGNAYFCTRNSGCSSARLEYASGGRVVAGSNPVTPTELCKAVNQHLLVDCFFVTHTACQRQFLCKFATKYSHLYHNTLHEQRRDHFKIAA